MTVAQFSSAIRNIPTEVPLGRADGLPKPCVVLLTIPKALLESRIAPLSAEKTALLDHALSFALGLDR